MDQGLLKQIKSLKQDLKEQFGINSIAIFGSYIKNENSINSDIDILVLNMDKKNAFTLLKAKKFLSESLKIDVDLGLIDSLRPFIRNRVEKEMINV